MQPKVIITCAVTGAGDTVGKSPHVPVTPEQIANAALEAASAGATVVHCHVRDPKTGKGSRDTNLYREVMERIRAKNKTVIINLTAGMGGDVVVGDGEKPLDFGPGTDCVGPLERLVHVKELRPEICTLDCGTLNFGDGQSIVVQTPTQLVILYEYMSAFRVIPFGAEHPDDILPSYMGNSIARWDGDTLVVDVTGFNDKTWLAGTGTFHSDALHIVERYTRVSKDRIDYEVTMEDPNVLTKPWTLRSSLMLREGTRLQEYVCAENNVETAHYEKILKEGVPYQR